MSVKTLWFSFTALALCAARTAAATSTTTVTATVLTETTTDGALCPMGWSRNEMSCYLYVPESANFPQARGNCAVMEAHLVYINSEMEYDFVRRMGQSTRTWLGLYRTSDNGCNLHADCNWMWLDDSDLVFNNFSQSGLPSSALCAFMTPTEWFNSEPCDTAQLTYVCEQNVSYPTTTPDSTTMMITTPGENGGFTAISPTDDNSDSGNGHTRIYIGVGVTLGVIFIASVVGVLAFYMRRKSSQARSTTTHTENVCTVAHDYANVDLQRTATREQTNDVYLNPVGVTHGAIHDGKNDTAYEQVVHYEEINPEYTGLRIAALN